MKSFLIPIIALFWALNTPNINPEKSGYIKIMHYGASTTKYIRPLIISDHALFIHLNQGEEDFIKQLQTMQDITREQGIQHLYDIVLTDSTTYSAAANFIENTKDCYTNDVNDNPENSSENFAVIANGKRHDLYWPYKYKFLAKLSDYLALKNCDKDVVKKIANYK